METYDVNDATNPVIVVNALPKSRRLRSQAAKDIYPAGFHLQHPRAKSAVHDTFPRSSEQAKLLSFLSSRDSFISWTKGQDDEKASLQESRSFFPSRSHTKSPKGMKDPSWDLDAYSSSIMLSQVTNRTAKLSHSNNGQSFMAWAKGQQASDSPKGPEDGDPFSDVAGPFYRKKTKDDFDKLPEIDTGATVEIVSKGIMMSTRNTSKPATPMSSQSYRATPPDLPRLLPIIAVPNGSTVISILGGDDLSTTTPCSILSMNQDDVNPYPMSIIVKEKEIDPVAPTKFPDYLHVDFYRMKEIVDSTKPAEAVRRVTIPATLELSDVYKIIYDQEAPGDCFDGDGRKMAPDILFFHPSLKCWRSCKSKSDWAVVKYSALEKDVPLKLMYSFKKLGIQRFQHFADARNENPELVKLLTLDLHGLDSLDQRALRRSLSSPKTCLLQYPLSDSPPPSPQAPEPLVSTPLSRGPHAPQTPPNSMYESSPSAATLLLDMNAPAPGARPPGFGRSSRASAREAKLGRLDVGSIASSMSGTRGGSGNESIKAMPRREPFTAPAAGLSSGTVAKVSAAKQELLACALEKRILKTRW